MNRDRFKDAPWIDPSVSVLVGGIGGIGSWLVLFLSRIGYTIAANDNDNVEEVNLAGQLYGNSSIGQTKVNAAINLLYDLSDTSKLHFRNSLIDEEMNFIKTKNMFSCFDNMKARKFMFATWQEFCKLEGNEDGIFIDGRLGADFFHMFAVRAGDTEAISKYKLELFDDSEVEDEPCTFKQTSHVAAMLASSMTSIFTNHVTNVKSNDDMHEIPFKTVFNVPLMSLQCD